MKITWQPYMDGSTTYYQCSIELDEHHVQAISRTKPNAFAHALEELAKVVRVTQRPNP